MKSIFFIVTVLILHSCGYNEDRPVSTPVNTPVDSTNTAGTAPADYHAPPNTNPPGSKDLSSDPDQVSGHRANTPDGDSIPSTRRHSDTSPDR